MQNNIVYDIGNKNHNTFVVVTIITRDRVLIVKRQIRFNLISIEIIIKHGLS